MSGGRSLGDCGCRRIIADGFEVSDVSADIMLVSIS